MKPLVSIIVIFFNEERFIQEAIDSVFAQTYEHWELLLVDDGSTDGSPPIAQQLAARYPAKVSYLQHDGGRNRGMSASRNLGLRHAEGEYVIFLDADDLLLADALKEQVALIEANPQAAFVYGPIRLWFSWTGDDQDRDRDRDQNLGVQPNRLIQPPQLVPVFLKQEGMTPSGMLIHQSIFNASGGFEESFPGMYEDQAFCAKVCLRYPVYVSGRHWYIYRQHPDSACAVAVRENTIKTSRLAFLRWLEGYLHEERFYDREVHSRLKKEIWSLNHPRLNRLLVRSQSFLNYRLGRFFSNG